MTVIDMITRNLLLLVATICWTTAVGAVSIAGSTGCLRIPSIPFVGSCGVPLQVKDVTTFTTNLYVNPGAPDVDVQIPYLTTGVLV
jgi:hypothetical protein